MMATYYPPEIMLLQGCPFQSFTRITWQVPNKGKGPHLQGLSAKSPGIAPCYVGTHTTPGFQSSREIVPHWTWACYTQAFDLRWGLN